VTDERVYGHSLVRDREIERASSLPQRRHPKQRRHPARRRQIGRRLQERRRQLLHALGAEPRARPAMLITPNAGLSRSRTGAATAVMPGAKTSSIIA
jgi:hypothetical protein